jgi:cytochrome c oxidase cbb3-type subunit 2
MKNGPLFFLGLFVVLTLSWAGTVLLSNHQLGALAPYYDENESTSFPVWQPGLAARGQLVYADLGCATCHTQQVRRPDFGSDQARGWGERQSVARDYIFQARPQLGRSRVGPDLTNLAARKPAYDAEDLMKLLYTGMIPGTKAITHPPYKFLFDERAIVGETSKQALHFTGTLTAPAGSQIVPTERAETLVAFLQSLNNTYDYPESRPMPVEKKKEGEHETKKEAAPAAKKEGEKK